MNKKLAREAAALNKYKNDGSFIGENNEDENVTTPTTVNTKDIEEISNSSSSKNTEKIESKILEDIQ